VLTEKPLATNLADAQHLVRLAERAGRRLAVMQNRRHDPEFVRFCDKLHAELGDQAGPLAVAADVCVPLHQPGFRVDQPLPVTTDLAVHGLDQIQALVPAAATLVSCVETPLPFLGGHCALAAITVRFTDGSVFAYRGGYTGAGLATPATGTWRVDGAGVSARWTDPGHGHDGATAQTPGYQRCITAMLDTLHGREPAAPATLTTVLRSTAMLEAALTSARADASPVPVAPIEAQS
jgi:predicted dehydrogenase